MFPKKTKIVNFEKSFSENEKNTEIQCDWVRSLLTLFGCFLIRIGHTASNISKDEKLTSQMFVKKCRIDILAYSVSTILFQISFWSFSYSRAYSNQ